MGKSRRARVIWTLLLLLVVGFVTLPWLISSEWIMQPLLARALPVRTAIHYDDLEFGWFSGLTIEALEVSDVPGQSEEAALRAERVQVQWSTLALLRAGLDVTLRIDAPRILVKKNSEGEVNWQDIIDPTGWDLQAADLPGARIHLDLNDGEVRFVDAQSGEASLVRELHVVVRHDGGREPASAEVSFALGPDQAAGGRFRFEATASTRTPLSIEGRLRTTELPVGRFSNFLPDLALVPTSGTLDIDVTLTATGGKELLCDGLVRCRDVVLRNTERPGETAHIASIEIVPRVSARLDTGRWDLEALQVDTPYFTLRGRPADQVATALPEARLAAGVQVDVDLDALGRERALLPTGIESLGGQISLRLVAGLPDAATATGGTRPLQVELQGTAANVTIGGERMPEGVVIPPLVEVVSRGAVNLAAEELQLPPVRASGPDFTLDADTISRTPAGWKAHIRMNGAAGFVARNLPGLLPEEVTIPGAFTVESEIELPADAAQSLAANGSFQMDQLRYLDNQWKQAAGTFHLAHGQLQTRVTEGKLNGGALNLDATLLLTDAELRPATLRLNWKNGMAGASLLPLLQYAAPMLAGSGADLFQTGAGRELLSSYGRVDFESRIGLSCNLAGPTVFPDGGLLATLGQWAGVGSLKLRDGHFAPSTALQQLLADRLDDGRLRFDLFESDFTLEEGTVIAPELRLGSEDPIVFRGKTRLDGDLDYEVALNSLLAGNKGAARVLDALGDSKVTAHLGGSLWSPDLSILGGVQSTLEGASGQLLEDLQNNPQGTVDRIKDLFGKKKRDGSP